MFIVFSITLSLLYYHTQGLVCMDEYNNPVEWYVVYKLPQVGHINPLITEGVAYTYITSNTPSDWKLSKISINDTNSIVGFTLDPLYTEKANKLYILYNDENPDGSVNFHKGHTKGVILGDINGGIWLVHSVPRFPSPDARQYYYPNNGIPYGQSFLCISLNIENLDSVGNQLLYNLPNIFSHNIPIALKWLFPTLTSALDNNSKKNPPWYHLQPLRSIEGTSFLSFAKGPKFVKELYLDWVAPTIGFDLYVETWPNEPGRIPSQCDIHFKVKNIKTVTVKVADISFESTRDHSKWAVSTNTAGIQWICVGDINRATAQRQRGGGTVCFNVTEVSTAYKAIIADTEPCANKL